MKKRISSLGAQFFLEHPRFSFVAPFWVISQNSIRIFGSEFRVLEKIEGVGVISACLVSGRSYFYRRGWALHFAG
jgi:hypothetical protein